MNELEIKLGLNELSPVEIAYKEPTEIRLKNVPKINQTEDLVKYVCNHDGMALRYVSKKLITQDLCEIAIAQNAFALRYVPEKFITYDLCYKAVSNNGRVLEYVPEDMRSLSISEKAVSYYLGTSYRNYYDTEGAYLSKNKARIEKAKVCGEELGEYQGYPISFVPDSLLTDDLITKSIAYSPFSLRDVPTKKITKEIIALAVSLNGLALKYVPKNYHSKALIHTALENQPLAIQYVMPKFITQEMCCDLFEKDYSCFSYFPEEFVSVDMCLHLIDIKRFAIFEVPEKLLIEKFGTADIKLVTFEDFPEQMRNNKQVLDSIIAYYKDGALQIINWNERIIEKRGEEDNQARPVSGMPTNKRNIEIIPLRKETIDYITPKTIYPEEEAEVSVPVISIDIAKTYAEKKEEVIVSLEPASKESLPVMYKSRSMVLHELSEDSTVQTIYYISDIHIEHQILEKAQKELNKRADIPQTSLQVEFNAIISELLEKEIDEMIEGKSGLLLIGGDVADSINCSRQFYSILSERWSGKIVSVLGNHELWDGTSPYDWLNPNFQARKVEEIVGDYREMINSFWKNYFLENELLIKYKNGKYCTISENDILEATPEDLRDIICKSSLVVLGGIGYSGLNEYYNSDMGLYRKTIISLDEDIRRANMFCAVYNKVKQCAYDKQIIVLTHTPVYDWTKEPCHENWIYINGHTHHNSIINNKNGAIVLSDNQVGYKPRKWKLNAFTTDRLRYDPFESYSDGIYKITSEEYKEFNQGRGISCDGCNYEGNLYALKRNGMYMFVLESTRSLCLMVGGARRKLERDDIQYYYDNMEVYGQRVLEAVKPYQKVMQQISQEVQNFGGTGTIHGCIVDISWFSHIYVNPFDGKITSYWALDTLSRIAYDDIKELLEVNEPELLKSFLLECNNHALPLIEKHLMTKNNCTDLALLPQWVFGMEMYASSRVMKSVQYVWEQNVIRIWNDDVINGKVLQIEETDKVIEE